MAFIYFGFFFILDTQDRFNSTSLSKGARVMRTARKGRVGTNSLLQLVEHPLV